MLWEKKNEKNRLPELPPLKTPFSDNISRGSAARFPDSDEDEDDIVEKHNLPSFPDSPHLKGFSQAAIKDAINTDEVGESGSEEKIIPRAPVKEFKTMELEEWSPSIDSSDKKSLVDDARSENFRSGVPEFKPQKLSMEVQKSQARKEVYVKIEKFYSARKALEDVQLKLEQIDELLRRIRETKQREEQEISSWERDLMQIKSRVQEITENIFEKLE